MEYPMPFSTRQQKQLDQIVKLVEKLRAEAERNPTSSEGTGRRRRSKVEAAKMRSEILAARAIGVSAAKLAQKYGVSTSYIYMVKE
jgi:hypothetical protein